MRSDASWVAVEAAAWCLALLGAVVAGRRRDASGPGPSMVPVVAPIGRLADSAAADSRGRAAERIAATDPVRMSHTPSNVVYAPGASATPGYQPAPPPAKPPLGVRGVFGERGRLRAILVGIPGRDGGVIVQGGDTLAGLRVLRVATDTVVVAGLDTTWKLTVHAGWQP